MNSIERKELRYQRRKLKRNYKKDIDSYKYGNINDAFTFHKVMFYAYKCCNGVRWKKSTFLFQNHMFSIIAKTCHDIKNNSYKVGNTYRFIINERGKIRNIDAPHIKDRLVHKVISNEIIIPIYSKHLIYDNGASQKDKGFIFALYRVKDKLQEYYRKYGTDGYAVLIDFSKFFENCSHDIIRQCHKNLIRNEYTNKVIEDYLFIGKGIALGVEIAQREASVIPNKLDHFIENNGCFVERYMDDTIFLVKSFDEALELLEKYINMAKHLNIKVNPNKTKIVKLSNYFKYCKWHFKLLDTGKVILIPDKSTIYRQRRKIRKMYNKYLNKKIVYNEIKTVKTCFKAYLNIGNSNKYINYLDKRYNEF